MATQSKGTTGEYLYVHIYTSYNNVMTMLQNQIGVFSLESGSKWYNELGSVMIIDVADPSTGVIQGQYCSKVGDATKFYKLVGRYDTASSTPTIGWAVTWQNQYNNAQSTTTWSGQGQYKSSGTRTILTTWLLTRQTVPSENWESTMVGFDVFSTIPPTAEQVEQAKYRCKFSHPKEA